MRGAFLLWQKSVSARTSIVAYDGNYPLLATCVGNGTHYLSSFTAAKKKANTHHSRHKSVFGLSSPYFTTRATRGADIQPGKGSITYLENIDKYYKYYIMLYKSRNSK